MKRIIQFICVLFMAYGTTKAQERIEYGVKAGLSASTLISNHQHLFEFKKLGFILGGYSRIPIGKGIRFQPEIIFAQKGKVDRLDNIEIIPHVSSQLPYVGDITTYKTLGYLCIPLNFNFPLSKHFELTVGGEPSFLISISSKQEFNGEEQYSETTFFPGGRVIDLGLSLGFNINVGQIDIGTRLVQGLIHYNDIINDNREYNSTLQLSVGYRLFRKPLYYD